VRAELPHTALALGGDEEPITRSLVPGRRRVTRLVPALRPGRAILVQVPLGRVPSLHLLLGPYPQGQDLVRRLL